MKKTILFLAFAAVGQMAAGQTLEECWQAAERNYPLIRQYGLIEKTTALTLDNLQKGWLPQVQVAAQGTLQSDAVSFPTEMQALYQQMGITMKGLSKAQYRIGVDVSQTVYDGGLTDSQKRVAREQGSVQAAETDVTLYQVRRRVNEMYFALLLTEQQLLLNKNLQEQLESSEQKLQAMVKGGTAAESDWLNVKAERLKVVQQGVSMESQCRMLKTLLSAFCGIGVTNVQKPAVPTEGAAATGRRPEMHLFDAQLRLADAQEEVLRAALKPKFSVFAQGYYGYPGMNMFRDMKSAAPSLNALVGARLTWNIGALYTRKNDRAKVQLTRNMTETRREVFLFNNKLEQLQQNEETDRFRRLMADDEEIIQLRAAVRRAAESKLAHGIIDANDLVREITQENAARVQQQTHEIEMLKEIYDNKVTDGKE